MMKIIIMVVGLLMAFPAQATKIEADCTYNGVQLFGKVRVVPHFGDIKVRPVNNFPDLKVKLTSFPNYCGEWELVEIGEDFTVEFVEIAEDITIEEVTHFPGL